MKHFENYDTNQLTFINLYYALFCIINIELFGEEDLLEKEQKSLIGGEKKTEQKNIEDYSDMPPLVEIPEDYSDMPPLVEIPEDYSDMPPPQEDYSDMIPLVEIEDYLHLLEYKKIH